MRRGDAAHEGSSRITSLVLQDQRSRLLACRAASWNVGSTLKGSYVTDFERRAGLFMECSHRPLCKLLVAFGDPPRGMSGWSG